MIFNYDGRLTSGTPSYNQWTRYKTVNQGLVNARSFWWITPDLFTNEDLYTYTASGDHTHDVTPSITTTYGVYENSTGNTLAQTDLVIKINGTTFTGTITSISGGWYEADITDELIDSDFSPTQSDNTIEFSTTTADKNAHIECSLAIVDIVQAVSIL